MQFAPVSIVISHCEISTCQQLYSIYIHEIVINTGMTGGKSIGGSRVCLAHIKTSADISTRNIPRCSSAFYLRQLFKFFLKTIHPVDKSRIPVGKNGSVNYQYLIHIKAHLFVIHKPELP